MRDPYREFGTVNQMTSGYRILVIKDLIIEKYASDAQRGAIYIEHARGRRISGVTARLQPRRRS